MRWLRIRLSKVLFVPSRLLLLVVHYDIHTRLLFMTHKNKIKNVTKNEGIIEG